MATIQGADAQLKAHYGIALNTGLTQIQLQEITQIITSKVNEDTGNCAKRIPKQ